MCIIMDGSESPIPFNAERVSFNGIAEVWQTNTYIYKRSIPFLIENEFGMFMLLKNSGYVPSCYRFDKYTLMIGNLGKTQSITDKGAFVKHMRKIEKLLQDKKIRHGDLTRYAFIVKNNHPYVIDFAESRFWDDPRPDKRPEGDAYWIERTIDELTRGL